MAWNVYFQHATKKKPKTGEESEPSEEHSVSEKLIHLIPRMFIGGVAAWYGYVILDTWRQSTVAQYYSQDG